MVSAGSSRSLHSNAKPVLAAALLAVLLAAPLAAFLPSAAAAPTVLTTLSDGSASASLYFASCGAEVGGVSITVPFDAVVAGLRFNLTSTGNATNQSGTVAVYLGGHEVALANASVHTTATVSLNGEALNAYLDHQGATDGEVELPFGFVGCSEEDDWWVDLDSIELTYRQPTAVTFEVTSPAASTAYTSASSITVAGTVSPSDCTVYVNEAAADVDGAEPVASWSVVVELHEGENGIRAVACSNYGNASVIERTVVRAEGSVNLSIESPSAHLVTNASNVTVRGTTDPNASVSVGGVNVTVNATTGAFEAVVELEEGENVITVIASDGAGGERVANITVIRDNTAPAIELHLGEDLAYAIEHGLNITWSEVTIAGSTDTDHVQVWVNDHEAAVEGSGFSARIALDQGENTVIIAAVDPAGNRAELTLTIWVDSVAPSIDLDLGENVTAAIEAGDALHQTTLDVRGSTDSADAVIAVNGHEANQTGLNFSRVVELEDGWNTIVIVAEDHAGNRREVHLTVLADLSNPGLAVTLDDAAREALAHERPVNRSTITAHVESNASTVRFTLNGDLVSEWNGSIDLEITLSEGNNTLLFEAIEGELTSSEEFHLKRDTVAPVLSVSLDDTTEDNGTVTAHSRLVTVLGTTEASATITLCTSGTGADATAWCHGAEVADNGSFHGRVELDAHHENLVTVTATDRAGNTKRVSFTVVYEAPAFTNDTAVSVHIGGTHEGTITAGSELVLEVGSAVEIPDGANVSWYVDGEYIGSGHRLADVTLEEGNHTIEVVVTTDSAQASATTEVHVEPQAARAPPSGGFPLWLMLALGLGAVGLALSSTDRGRYALFALVAGSVFTRFQKPAPLDHFVRGQLFQLVRDEPGIHYAELMRRAKLSNGAAGYHLSVLEKAGVLRTVQDGTRTRFYPTDAPLDRETYGLSDGDRAVLENVAQAPGISETELSEKVGKSLSTVSRSVDRMAALGYVTTTRQGRTVSVFPRAGTERPHATGAVELPDADG